MPKNLKNENAYYPIIKTKIEDILKNKFDNWYLEITAKRKFSNKLKREISPQGRDIIFHFLREAAPDITGFIKKEYSSDFLIAEIKTDEIKLDYIYQTRKYAELFGAKYSLLISTEEIPEEIKRLSRPVHTLLSGGIGYEKITLVYFDPIKEEFSEWFEKNPFGN
ncbi:MAG: hypothetical protein NTV10_00220 [Methanoregula sp.]|nr:hypothetical protein [Methanoregula sp.]